MARSRAAGQSGVAHAPGAKKVHDVRALLGPAGVDQVALPAGLHEHAVALPDVYEAHGKGAGGRRVRPTGRGRQAGTPAGRQRQDQDEQKDGEQTPAGRS